MKPRNKFEKAVFAESKNLRQITKTQCKWAFRECIDHFAYRLPKGRTTCMDCGHSWTMEKPKDTCTCPHCRARLQVRETFERKIRQKQYFTILTTCGEYQVQRMFLLSAEMEKGCKATSCVVEIGQYWWNAQGRKTIVAIQRVLGKYIDTFSYCSPMAVRNDNEAYRHISYSQIYPKFKATDTLRRNGFKNDFHGIVPTILIPALLSDSRAETLMKAGRTEHLKYFLDNSRAFDACWQSYKVATRNGYDIEDISIWCDYVDMLRRLNKDIWKSHSTLTLLATQ
ncbi:PcfJ-like protein, partial [Phocaeicola vulgatus]